MWDLSWTCRFLSDVGKQASKSFERSGDLLEVPMHKLMEELSGTTAAKLAFQCVFLAS